jgi:hypothetical protein
MPRYVIFSILHCDICVYIYREREREREKREHLWFNEVIVTLDRTVGVRSRTGEELLCSPVSP